jgi:hypothetical protein
MKLSELETGAWFRWPKDGNILQRYRGEMQIIEGREMLPVVPITPHPNLPGAYLPIDEEVEPYRLNFVRLN